MAYHKHIHKNKKNKTTKDGDKKQIKWRIGDLIQYNSDPENDNDKTDNINTRQGTIIDYKEGKKQISIQRQDDEQIYNYFINDITMIYNITKSGHPKTTYGALIKHHKEIHEEKINDLKSKIHSSKQNKDKSATKENRSKLKELKSQIKTERNEIKRQTKALRKKYDPEKDKNKYEDQHIEEKDCWEYRLPNMQQFIINISNKPYKNKTDKRLRNILTDYKINKTIDSTQAIEGIIDWIDNKMPNALPYATKPKEMSKIISNLSNNIIDILTLILEDKQFCNEICSRSYHHDLFEKMVIMTGKKGWKLRLHLFRQDNLLEIQEELHSHRNHFLSTCLYGKITQKVWEIVKDDSDENENNDEENKDKDKDENEDEETVVLHKYTYDPKGDAQNREFNIIKHEEKVKLKCVKLQTTSIDDMYYMHPSIIHQVVKCEGKTITLVLNTKTVMLKSCFGSQQQWHSQQFKRKKFDNNELNDILSMAIKLIKSNQD